MPHCCSSTSHRPCLSDGITYLIPWEELPESYRRVTPQPSSDPTWWLYLTGWKFASIWATEVCRLLAVLPTDVSMFPCVSTSAVFVLFSGTSAFCSMVWKNIIQPGSSESSTCRRKSFVLCYRSSFSWASSFKLGSLYPTLCSSTQTFFLFCVGNVLGIRSRGMFSLLIGKYVFTWLRQAIYLYTLQSCPIMTGKIIRTHRFFTSVLIVPHLVCRARLQDTGSVAVSAGSLPLLQVLK